MTELISQLRLYLGYSFVRYALVVGVLIALCSSLLGVTLVLKRASPSSEMDCPMWPSAPWPLRAWLG